MADFFYKNVIIYQSPDEQSNLRQELKKVKDLEGDIIEVGVFQGGSAGIMREELEGVPMYLFDTFTGFADELHESDFKGYKVGHCATDESFVTELFKDEKDVHIVKGVFPKTSKIVEDKKFRFAIIDVDIYNPTLNSLNFIFPRMVKGGIIYVHDYPAHPGVKLACDEWLKDKNLEIWNPMSRQLFIYV